MKTREVDDEEIRSRQSLPQVGSYFSQNDQIAARNVSID